MDRWHKIAYLPFRGAQPGGESQMRPGMFCLDSTPGISELISLTLEAFPYQRKVADLLSRSCSESCFLAVTTRLQAVAFRVVASPSGFDERSCD